jgi:hypothetical protein
MRLSKKTEKKPRTLLCDDCTVEVPVGDDAIGVVCTSCTQKRLNTYEHALNAPEDEINGDDNLAVEGTHDRVKAKKPKVKVLRKRKMKKSKVK